MNKRLLIGELMLGVSAGILDHLNNMGIEVSCCSNEPTAIMQEISRTHYDGVLITIMHESGMVYSLLRQIRSISPDISIIAALYTGAESVCRECILSGADKCIIMPVSQMEMSIMICTLIDSRDDLPYMAEIASILSEQGFPQNLMGFYYLCIAVELCLTSTEAVNSVSKKIYPEVAQRMNTLSSLVERSLRHYSGILYSRGIITSGRESDDECVMSNRELISFTADIVREALCDAEEESKQTKSDKILKKW